MKTAWKFKEGSVCNHMLFKTPNTHYFNESVTWCQNCSLFISYSESYLTTNRNYKTNGPQWKFLTMHLNMSQVVCLDINWIHSVPLYFFCHENVNKTLIHLTVC